LDEAGEKVDAAAPSRAVELVGLGGLPAAGDSLVAVENEAAAREIAAVRQQLERERRASSLFVARSTADRESFLGAAAADALPLRVLDFVVKSDVQGSAEALASAIEALEAADDKLQVKTRVLRSGAGAVTSEDVMLASVSNAIVIGFNSQASRQTADEAAKANIELKEYSVVYDALDEIKAMMDKLIRPPPSKQLGSIVGTADVLQTFKIADVGKVAGCRLLDGYIRVGCNIRILRGNLIVYEGKLRSLRSVKSVVEQVDAPNECGVSFDDYQGMEVDDRVEVYLPKEGQGTDFE
jgi:translation initiation factor IF-2